MNLSLQHLRLQPKLLQYLLKILFPHQRLLKLFYFLAPFFTSKIALNCGTPIPATNLVVQIEPGPIPTFIISTPSFIKNLAASAVAIFPAQSVVWFVFFFFNFFYYFRYFFSMSVCGIYNN